MEKKQLVILLKRFMHGSLNKSEMFDLLKGFQSDNAKESLDEYCMQYWVDSENCTIPPEKSQRIWHNIQAGIRGKEEKNNRIISFKYKSFKWLGYAAAFALIFTCSVLMGHRLGFNQANQTAALHKFTVEADKGQRASVILPDGTKVWLNSHSKLEYNSLYATEKRAVKLTGEAYFDVARDTTKEFIVDAGELTVKVLGTSFNIKAYEDDNFSVASLISGSIKTEIGDCSYVLKPNKSIIFDKLQKKTYVRHCNSQRATMWRNNELVFNGESLGEIAVLLNRLYNVKIEFESENIKRYKFSGVIVNNSLDNVIELISLTAPITYTKENSTIRIRSN